MLRNLWGALICGCALLVGQLPACGATLGMEGSRMTLDGASTFLLGFSYYAGLGASEEFVKQDLDDAQRYGFNWLRVWVTWESFGADVSAVDDEGNPRPAYLEKLKWLAAECDRRGMVVDLTLARGAAPANEPVAGRLRDFAAHERAVRLLATELKPWRNWYIDLANERDVRDARYVSEKEIRALRDLVKELDGERLVTASFGGHDLKEKDLRNALETCRLDFVTPHRPRDPRSPGQTGKEMHRSTEMMQRIGRVAPVIYQEPFRRGYTNWEPTGEDFLTDLRGAISAGAAGWCFHNGAERKTPDGEPRRSFDLRTKRLFEQLDSEEQKFLEGIREVLSMEE